MKITKAKHTHYWVLEEILEQMNTSANIETFFKNNKTELTAVRNVSLY